MAEVVSEWPGAVTEILVAVGDQVGVGDELLSMESMKMITPVESPVAGTVAQIHVQSGDAVEVGDRLVTIDG